MTKDLKSSLAWAVGIIAVALAATFARRLGAIDGDTVTRIVLGVTGLMVAWYGNRMPKTFVPNAGARQGTRVGGWSMALSGLVYAGLWAFAPLPVALFVGCGAILVGMAVTIGYCLTLRNRMKPA
jgi:hypothetical protein